MKKNLVKRIISGMSAMAIVASVMPSIPVSAYGNMVYEEKYKTMINEANSKNITKKTVDLYYLPAWYGDNKDEYRNWTMPANLPTSYNIPEWNSYTWEYNAWVDSGTVSAKLSDTTKWQLSDQPEDTFVCDVYGINNDSQIHYTFNIHNYAYTLREQEMDRLIAKYITPDMTDYEKVCKVIDIVAAGQYGSGDPILTKGGDCIDAANAVVYLLRKLGIKARMRRCVDDMFSGNNHYNNYVIIDGELYIVEASCINWENLTQSWDTIDYSTLSYEERIEIMPSKRASWEDFYIRKANDWEGLINGAGLTDGKYVYKKLDDGTLALYDIVGLDGDTSATWTVPTTATINGTTYTVSTIGNIGNQTYQCTQTDLCENGRYGESYWYNTPYKQIIIPEGIKLSDEKSNLTNCFGNVEQITTNGSVTNLHNKFDNEQYNNGSALVIDGSNSTLKDVPYTAKTVYTNVTNDLRNFFGPCEGEFNLCDVSDPNTRTLTGTVDIEVHNSNITLTNESGAIYYPILESDFKSFRFLGIPQGKYTFKISIDGYNDYVQEVTVSNSNISFGYIIPTVKHDHSYTSKVTKAASCETAGIKTYTCGICGDSYTETIPATGHSWNTGTVTKAADCETTGIKTYTCSKCGGTKTGNIPATGHSYTDTVVEPTYTSEGYTLHTCIYCGDTYEDNYTPKLEETHTHSYTSTVTKAATCTATGIRTYTCSCGESYTEEIPKTAHSYTTKVVAPTYDAQGYTLHTCTECGDSYKDNYTDKLHKHSYKSVVTKAATCTEEGIRTYTCIDGDDTYTEVIPKTAHKYTSKVVAPTYDTQGYTLHTCSVCGDSYKDTYTDKLSRTNISTCTISLSAASYVYNGYAKKPAVTVKNGSTTLRSGTDYTVTYSNNTNIGTATVTITGKGAYTGTLTKTFSIIPANVTGMNAVATGQTAIKLGWTAVKGATGYVVYQYVPATKSWKRVAVTKTNSQMVSGLTGGTTYAFTARAYTTVSGKNVYDSTAFKTFFTTTNPAKPYFAVASTAKGRAYVRWNKVAGATGYVVYYRTAGGSWQRAGVVKNNVTSFTKNGLKNGTAYAFAVRAYRNYNGINYYGAFDQKGVKIK